MIAPDHIGFGKSDKPVQLADDRFLQHVAWVEEFIDVLGLDAITPVVQDRASLIGLRAVGNRPERVARVVVANGNLLVLPEGMKILHLPDSLEPHDLEFPDVISPGGGVGLFEAWATSALVGGTSCRRCRCAELAAHIVDWMRTSSTGCATRRSAALGR